MGATGIALLATALVINWQLGLVMLAFVPFIGASVAILSKLMSSSAQEGTDHYEKAGGVATEVCMYVCMYVCIFIKLHITAQSGLVILVILCHSR